MERSCRARIERIENLIDQNTKKLIILFRIINAGRYIEVPEYGEMRELVVLGGILHGIRKGEVEFEWLKTGNKERRCPQVKFVNGGENYKVLVTIEQGLLELMENDVESIGGAYPIYFGIDNIFGKLREVNRKNQWRIRGWDEISLALTSAYTFYRHI